MNRIWNAMGKACVKALHGIPVTFLVVTTKYLIISNLREWFTVAYSWEDYIRDSIAAVASRDSSHIVSVFGKHKEKRKWDCAFQPQGPPSRNHFLQWGSTSWRLHNLPKFFMYTLYIWWEIYYFILSSWDYNIITWFPTSIASLQTLPCTLQSPLSLKFMTFFLFFFKFLYFN